MQENLPAQTIEISPEALEVANCYLQHQNAAQVASELGLDPQLVTELLGRREVQSYIDHVFMDTGYNNRFLLRKAMDALIRQKFQELESSETGSNKDIADLLQLSHKISMDHLDREIQLEKLRQTTGPSRQVNVQINDADTSRYAQLVQRLVSGEGI